MDDKEWKQSFKKTYMINDDCDSYDIDNDNDNADDYDAS